MSEQLLLKRVRQGDLSAWRQLIHYHQDVVFQLAYLALTDQASAQDITQQTFLRAFNHLHTLDDKRSLRAWLLELCWCNVSAHGAGLYRLRHTLKRLLQLIDVNRAAPRQQPEVDGLWTDVKQYPAEDQQLIYLRLFLGLSLAEVAQASGTRLNQIRLRLARIYDRLAGSVDRISLTNSLGADRWDGKLAAVAASFDFPQTPTVDRFVIDEIEGNNPYQFKSQPLRWTAAALVAISIALASVGSLSKVKRTTDQATGFARANSVGQYSPASADRGFKTEPMTALNLAGITTLEAARQEFPFPLLLPAGMPPPDRIYLQNAPAAGLIMIWFDGDGQQELALFQLAPNARYSKLEASIVGRPIVNGEPALWIEGNYSVLLEDGKLVWSGTEGGRLLVWSQGDLGLRLETKGSLSVALELAESLQ